MRAGKSNDCGGTKRCGAVSNVADAQGISDPRGGELAGWPFDWQAKLDRGCGQRLL
jgi:hypothetical protein